jgi:hypothetical protein
MIMALMVLQTANSEGSDFDANAFGLWAKPNSPQILIDLVLSP